jgi:hypothetical protein
MLLKETKSPTQAALLLAQSFTRRRAMHRFRRTRFSSTVARALPLHLWDTFEENVRMATDFKPGDHVEWNSEAGLVRGTIQKKVTSEITFKGYKRHASKEEPQYVIKSDTTDHIAIHKRSALRKIKKTKKSKG